RYPVVLRAEPSFPEGPADFDKWFADLRAGMECRDADCNGRRAEDVAWWGNVASRPVGFFARRLHLDARGEAGLHGRLDELAVKVGAGPELKVQPLGRLALDYRAAGDFAHSTQAWTQLAGILREPDRIRLVADGIDLDRRAAEALSRSPQRELLR